LLYRIPLLWYLETTLLIAWMKIAICEDHALIVNGVKSLLNNHPEFEVVGHASNEAELTNIIRLQHPDVLILDLNLSPGNGFDILTRLRSEGSPIKVLILTMYFDESMIEKARLLKANGYLLKSSTGEEILEALGTIHNNGFYISHALQEKRKKFKEIRDEFVDKMRLTAREVEIIRLIVQGKTNEEIGELLFLSTHTVRTHRKNIMKKLALGNAADLVRFAYDSHLV
jgi:DNA-binding NarL/FixJ family response regulator